MKESSLCRTPFGRPCIVLGRGRNLKSGMRSAVQSHKGSLEEHEGGCKGFRVEGSRGDGD